MKNTVAMIPLQKITRAQFQFSYRNVSPMEFVIIIF